MTDLPSNSIASPVFIVGAPRSGTTMLQYILDELPNLSLPTGESHFIVPLFKNQKAFTNLDTRDGMHYLLQAIHSFNPIFLYGDLHGIKYDADRLADDFLAEGRASVRDVIQGIFEKNAAGMGKTRWGDKTPYYALHIDKLITWWPDAKIIHLVRDGRDVALSLFGRKHDFNTYNLYYAAQYWQQYVDVCREKGKRMSAGQYLEIRYEDILDNKGAAMRVVCDFIGEPYPTAKQQVDSAQCEATRQLRTVNKNNQGKWRKALNAWQICVFESEAGSSLKMFGYPVLTSTRRLPLPIRALYRWHNNLSTKLYRLLGRNRIKLNSSVLTKRT